MATREAPPTEQVIEALSNRSNLALMHLGDDQAVSWMNAILRVRHAFRTNTPKAEQWLLDITNAENSPLILIENAPVVARLTGPTLASMVAQRLDWPDEVHRNFKFNKRGRLVRSASGARTDSYSDSTRWVVLRDALFFMRDCVIEDIDENDRQRRETRERDAAAFNAIHGADYETIRAFFDAVNIAIADQDASIDPDAISTWMSKSAKHTEIWGTPGSMTINLRGNQITAVADQLRALLNR